MWGDEGFEADRMAQVGGHFGEVAVVDAQEEAVVVVALGGFDDGKDAVEVGFGVDF